MRRLDGSLTAACWAHLDAASRAAITAERGDAPRCPGGSVRRPSPARTARHVGEAAAAAALALDRGRPAETLAVALYAIDRRRAARPSGRAGRRDHADRLGTMAALLVAMGDHRSGRRARPGRAAAADILDRCERGISRYCAELEALGVVRRVAGSGRLRGGPEREAAEREAAAGAAGQPVDDPRPDVDAAALAADGKPNRRANRAEWDVIVPAWARDVTDAELAPYVAEARRRLAELARTRSPMPARTSPAARPPAGPGPTGPQGSTGPGRPGPGRLGRRPRTHPLTVTLSPGGLGVGLYVPVRRTKISRPAGREDRKGAASRPSPTKRIRPEKVGHFGSGRPLQAYPLARELALGAAVPILRGLRHEQVCQLASGLDRRGLAHWTVADVAAHIDQAARAGRPIPALIAYPVAWTLARLDDADPAAPPDQLRRAAQLAAAAEQRTRQAEARTAAAERAAAAVPAAAVPEYVTARAELPRPRPAPPAAPPSSPAPALRGAALARAELAAARARRATPAAAAEPVPQPPPTAPPRPRPAPVGLAQARTRAQLRPAGQCVTCGSTGPDVRLRATTTGAPLTTCDQHAAWIAGDDPTRARRI